MIFIKKIRTGKSLFSYNEIIEPKIRKSYLNKPLSIQNKTMQSSNRWDVALFPNIINSNQMSSIRWLNKYRYRIPGHELGEMSQSHDLIWKKKP